MTKERAAEIIQELNDRARQVDHHDYGLPLFNDEWMESARRWLMGLPEGAAVVERTKVATDRPARRELAPDDSTLMTVDDVAQALNVSKQWCYACKFLPWIKCGGHKRLKRSDLQAFLTSATPLPVMRQRRTAPEVEIMEAMD